jgi:uncharacterized membrane protein YphA (DoxX/SURF4 family)
MPAASGIELNDWIFSGCRHTTKAGLEWKLIKNRTVADVPVDSVSSAAVPDGESGAMTLSDKKTGFCSNAPYTWIRWALGAVFLYAGAGKLADPHTFAVLIDAYGLVPPPLLMPVAVGLPVLEVAAAIGLMADLRGSLAMTAALIVLFVCILIYGIHMGLDVDCGCFGPEDPEAEAFHGLRSALYRDVVMLAGIGYLYWLRFSRSHTPAGLKRWFMENRQKRRRYVESD